MKKSIFDKSKFLILFGVSSFALLPHSSQAQMAFAIGPKVGLAISSVKVENGQDIQSKTTAQGGIFLNWQLHKVFAIQPELILSQKGAVYTKNGTRTDMKLNYFEVPVLAKIRLPLGDVFFPHFLIGPDFAFNTNATYTSVDAQSGVNYYSTSGNPSATDFGGLIGGGFDIQAKHLFFTMDARYGYGFNKAGDGAYDVRNKGWAFTMGIGWRVGSGSGL